MSLEASVDTPLRSRMPEPEGRFRRDLTAAQADAIYALGGADAAVRHAAVGSDVFVYLERAGATLRFQVSADGDLVGQTRFARRTTDLALR